MYWPTCACTCGCLEMIMPKGCLRVMERDDVGTCKSPLTKRGRRAITCGDCNKNPEDFALATRLVLWFGGAGGCRHYGRC